jgi:hypothetical protein
VIDQFVIDLDLPDIGCAPHCSQVVAEFVHHPIEGLRV